jgi:glutamate 5-kinase
LQVKGQLLIDVGAMAAIKEQGKSLLAVGVKSISGSFERGELVSCVDESGLEVARGLVNYGHVDAHLIMGKSSSEFESILGYADDAEMIHRDNLVLI